MRALAIRRAIYADKWAAFTWCMYSSLAPATFAADVKPTPSEERDTLGEVIVTAIRREASVQDTPIAINAYTSQDIESNRIYEFGDLAAKIPGFSVNSFNKARTNPALRGGSSNLTGPGSDNAIAVFVDDVYYGNAADFEFDFFNLERIEVLRGPQGTLFGRNSTGGSINVVTKDPTANSEGAIEVGIGNYNLVQSRGFAGGALNSAGTLLGSMSFSTTNRRGTSFNRTTGNYMDNLARQSGRAKLKWIVG
jgi:iron complex outermembrane receptor protein